MDKTTQGLKLHQIVCQSFVLVAKNLVHINHFKM
jgi:hypothetical protein